MPISRVQITSAAPVKWSDGTLFNGYVLLILALPTQGVQQWTQVALRNSQPKLKVPQRVKIPIKEGVFDNFTLAWSNDSLVPENTQYSVWFYDDTDQLIAIGAQLFQILANGANPFPYVLPIPALPVPNLALTSPQPGSAPSSQVNTVIYGAPIRENVNGTKNGVNTAFTINSAVYSVVLIIYNQTVLTQGVEYTISGANVTMIAPYLPNVGDQLEDVRW